MGSAMSPLLNILGELSEANGSLVVRSMKLGDRYCARFDAALDSMNTLVFANGALINCGSFLAYVIALCVAGSTLFIVLNFTSPSPGRLGIVLTYSLLLPYFLNLLAMVMIMLNLGIACLERLLQ